LDPPSLVNKLRVLAVRAQIPNPVPNSQTFADAIPGDMVTLDALVAGTEGDVDGGVPVDQIDYLWLACVPPPGSTSVRDCAGSAAPMAGFLPPCRGLSTDSVCLIGAGATVTFPTPPDPISASSSIYVSVVVAVKAPSQRALDCLQRLAQDQPPGDSCVVALKTLTIQPTNASRNSNPAVSTFNANGNDIHSTPMLFLGNKVGVTPLPLPAVSSEEKPDGTGEVLTYSWFSTQKDFDHFHSGYNPKPPPGENSENTYINQSTMCGRVHFWLVLRDDRGGVDWTDGFADFVMP